MIRAYSEKETIVAMIVETQNELTKWRVMDRIYQRLNLTSNGYQQAMGLNQMKIREAEKSLDSLHNLLNNCSTDAPLDINNPIYQTEIKK